jgi:WD40 repeat protein
MTNRWDLEIEENSSVKYFIINEQNKSLYTGCINGTINIWDLKYSLIRKLAEPVKAHSTKINCIIFYEEFIFTGSDDKIIKAFSYNEEKGLLEYQKTYSGHTDGVVQLKIISYDKVDYLYSYARDNNIICWDKNMGNMIKLFTLGEIYSIVNLGNTIQEDGIIFLLADPNPLTIDDLYFISMNIKVNSKNQNQSRKYGPHRGQVKNVVTLSENSNRIFSISEDGFIRKFDYQTGEVLNSYFTRQKGINSLYFYNNFFYSASDDGKIIECECTEKLLETTETLENKLLIKPSPKARRSGSDFVVGEEMKPISTVAEKAEFLKNKIIVGYNPQTTSPEESSPTLQTSKSSSSPSSPSNNNGIDLKKKTKSFFSKN